MALQTFGISKCAREFFKTAKRICPDCKNNKNGMYYALLNQQAKKLNSTFSIFSWTEQPTWIKIKMKMNQLRFYILSKIWHDFRRNNCLLKPATPLNQPINKLCYYFKFNFFAFAEKTVIKFAQTEICMKFCLNFELIGFKIFWELSQKHWQTYKNDVGVKKNRTWYRKNRKYKMF